SKVFNDNTIESSSGHHLMTLFKLELKKFFSLPLYVINSLTGKIITVIMVFVFVFNDSFTSSFGDVDRSLIFLIIVGTMIFMSSITSTTSATISLEGKNFWIL